MSNFGKGLGQGAGMTMGCLVIFVAVFVVLPLAALGFLWWLMFGLGA